MLHPFQAAAWNKSICSKCLASELMHGSNVTCDSCSNVGLVDKVGKLFLCEACARRELSTIPAPIIAVNQEPSIEKILENIDKLAESNTVKNIMDAAIKGNIKQYRDFFNADIPSIIELKALIDADESI